MPSPRKKTPAGTRRLASRTVPTGIAGRTRSRSRTRQAIEQEEPVPVPVVKPGRTPARRVAKATNSPQKLPSKSTTIKFSPIRTRRVVARQEQLKNQETEEEEESSVVLEEEAPVSLRLSSKIKIRILAEMGNFFYFLYMIFLTNVRNQKRLKWRMCPNMRPQYQHLDLMSTWTRLLGKDHSASLSKFTIRFRLSTQNWPGNHRS